MTIQLFVRPVDPGLDQFSGAAPAIANPDQVFEWALVDFNGLELAAGVDTFDGISQVTEQQSISDALMTVILPSQHVGYVLAQLTPKQARYMQQALPFAVEELIAEDIESVHLVADDRLKTETINGFPTWVVRRKLFEAVYNDAIARPVGLEAIVCEAAIVLAAHESIVSASGDDPSRGEHIHLFFDQPGVSAGEDGFTNSLPVTALICSPGRFATSVPAEAVELVLSSMLNDQAFAMTAPDGVEAVLTSAGGAEAALAADEVGMMAHGSGKTLHVTVSDALAERYAVLLGSLESNPDMTVRFNRHKASPFAVLCDYATRYQTPNFCVAPYQSQFSGRSTGLSQWQPVALAAGLVFGVLLAFNGVRGYFYEQQSAQLRDESMALYKSVFPNDRRITNPRRQMEGKLNNAGAGGAATDFLQMLGEAGYRLSSQPDSQSISFNSLQYNAQRGELAVEVRAAALAQIDQYKRSLDQAGYQVDIGSAIKENNGVRGKLTLRGAPEA